jgi:hypothetical protein
MNLGGTLIHPGGRIRWQTIGRLATTALAIARRVRTAIIAARTVKRPAKPTPQRSLATAATPDAPARSLHKEFVITWGKKRMRFLPRFYMSFEKLVEEKIRQAMADGEFDNLPGRGKPLNMDAYFATPEDMRISYSVLKNAGVIPEQAELLKELESLRLDLEQSVDENERIRIKRSIEAKVLKLNMMAEYYKRRRR